MDDIAIYLYSGITTITSAVFAYFWYRKKEAIILAKTLIDAWSDKTVTRSEFDKIAHHLSDVLYKNK